MSSPAEVIFWGVRGSTPCDGHQFNRYGGNTSCVEFKVEGHDPIVFDLGTGLRNYGEHLEADGQVEGYRATVLLSHLHWDHIQGLPFFQPLAPAAARCRSSARTRRAARSPRCSAAS